MNELYLAHYGTLGQRWGFRRFQNKDGTLTAAGKQRYSKENSSPRHKPSAARQQARAEERAREFEARRQHVLRTGNATDVLKYREHSSQAEMDAALRRIQTERQLADISAKETARGKSAVDKVIDSVDTWRARGEKVASVWNFVAKVHNSLADEDDAWQQIGQSSVTEAKEKRAKERHEKADQNKKDRIISKAISADEDNALNYDSLKKLSQNLSANELSKMISRQLTANKTERDRKEKEARAERDRKAGENYVKAKKNELVAKAVARGKFKFDYDTLTKIASGMTVSELEDYINRKETGG